MTNDINNKYLVFEVDEEYAIDLLYVLEIIEFQPVTAVPETPDYVAGIINLRGQVVPVIDVRTRFHKEKKEYTSRTCIIIIQINGQRLGLIVDFVVDLLVLEDGALTAPPQIGNNYANVFIKAIGIADDCIKLIIDSEKLINYDDLDFTQIEGPQ